MVKMRIFIVALFTLLMMLAMRTGDWVAYVLVLTGFLVMLQYTEDLM